MRRIPEAISDRQATMVEPLPSRQILPPSCSPRRKILPGLRRWPDGADNHSGAKGVYGVKQVIVVDRIAERLQMARKTAPI